MKTTNKQAWTARDERIFRVTKELIEVVAKILEVNPNLDREALMDYGRDEGICFMEDILNTLTNAKEINATFAKKA